MSIGSKLNAIITVNSTFIIERILLNMIWKIMKHYIETIDEQQRMNLNVISLNFLPLFAHMKHEFIWNNDLSHRILNESCPKCLNVKTAFISNQAMS